MVVAASREACAGGRDVLAEGGNAVDAAVAVGFALAVSYPFAGNIGGGGFLIYRASAGEAEAIDFRETAPGLASREMFLGPNGEPDPDLSLWSPLAAGVPGTVAGLGLLHERHGTVPWGRLLAPAVAMARDGIAVSRFQAEKLRDFSEHTMADSVSRRILLDGGRYFSEGDTLRQPELAATLARVARDGPQEFYGGETARLLVEYMERIGGIITAEDLRVYRPVVREVLRGVHSGYTILSMPPPSSGGIALLEMLNILEGFPLSKEGWGSARGLHLVIEAMRQAYADRAAYLGDADFVPVPAAGLLDRGYADSLRLRIVHAGNRPRTEAVPGRPAGAEAFLEAVGGSLGLGGAEGDETTHYSIVDGEGNAVSATVTLNAAYGSGLTVEGAGFLLNNEMDDFASKPGASNDYGLIQGKANTVAPHKRPLSSMTPVIVLFKGEDGGERLHLVTGSPGGSAIITSVLQVVLNVLTYRMGIQEAVNAPRLHHQWMPDTVYVETSGWPAEVPRQLEAMGYAVRARELPLGSTNSIFVDSTGTCFGAPDPRRSSHGMGFNRPSGSDGGLHRGSRTEDLR